MGRIFWQISTTLDGYMEGPDGELDQTAGVTDHDFEAYASKMLESIDAFIIGRKTYDVFVEYWPTASGPDADRLNALPKYVVSGTIEKVDWNNGSLIRPGDLEPEVRRLRDGHERDIAVFGSATLAASLAKANLIDEFRILVTPFILGNGNRAFKGDMDQHDLILRHFEKWESGTMFLTYRNNQKENS